MDKLEQRIEVLEEANRDNVQDLLQRVDELTKRVNDLETRLESLENACDLAESVDFHKYAGPG
jgi:hypothetical protein